MVKPACSRRILRGFLALLLSMLVSAPTLAQESSGGDLTITINVVAPYPPRTVTAMLTANPRLSGANRVLMNLVVFDERGSGNGWLLDLGQLPTGNPEDLLWITHFQRQAEHVAGQMPEGVTGPFEDHFAIVQSLDQPKPLLAAPPGAGAGVYRIPFALNAPGINGSGRFLLILSNPSAP